MAYNFDGGGGSHDDGMLVVEDYSNLAWMRAIARLEECPICAKSGKLGRMRMRKIYVSSG